MQESSMNESLPRAVPPVITHALLRVQPEDFQVEEIMPHVLSGSGEHLWVRVRKRGCNTDFVAKALAQAAGIARRDVSYAGMKDRHAITVQWFSLQLPGQPDPVWSALPDGVEILESVRHNRKLKTGGLSGNRFVLTLRECDADRGALDKRLDEVRAQGVPNYFGEQRFGHGGANVARARRLFESGETIRDRHLRGILLSSARSWIFNAVLAARVRDGSWQPPQAGEVFMLDGSRSFFPAAVIDDVLRKRLARADIHLTGPLWGHGELPTQGAVRDLEAAIAATEPVLCAGLEAAGLEQERRALRLIPKALTADWIGDRVLRVAFSLSAGTYATVVLRALAEYRDVSGPTPEGD